MAAEPVTPVTPRPLEGAWISQTWRHVALAHWAIEPAAVQSFLPRGVEVDTIDGATHVGLIGFRMVRAGARGLGVPLLGSFWETNVRLYSVDRQGRRGVVFVSLESSRLLATIGARLGFGLPYTWARMSVERRGDVARYRSRRLLFGPRPATSELAVRIGERISAPTPLEHWLTARWGLHVDRGGRARYLPNEHLAWPLHRAELLGADTGLLPAAGIRSPSAPPSSVLYSPGVEVRFGSESPA